MDTDVRDSIAEVRRVISFRVSLSIWWHVQHKVSIFCLLVPTSGLLVTLNKYYILLSFLIFNLFSNSCPDRIKLPEWLTCKGPGLVKTVHKKKISY